MYFVFSMVTTWYLYVELLGHDTEFLEVMGNGEEFLGRHDTASFVMLVGMEMSDRVQGIDLLSYGLR